MEAYLQKWKASQQPPVACDLTESIKVLAQKLADDAKVKDTVTSIWAVE